MNLLPKSHEEFSQKAYWDSFFKKRGNKAFEWYGEYPELSEHLHKYIKPQDEILITGCGNSTLGKDLYDVGYHKITNIDISPVAIRQMLSQTDKPRPTLTYLQMDALHTTFAPSRFSVLLDKGTLDALMPDASPPSAATAAQYFAEIHRLLRHAGRYLCVSLLQAHILAALLAHFPAHHYLLRVVRCHQAENGDRAMPVFLVVATKFAALPRPLLELALSANMQRCASAADLAAQVAGAQHAAFIRRARVDSELRLDLHQPGEEAPRFTVHVVDAPPRTAPYAAFIVPQGREVEWLFATKDGRAHLAEMAKASRLAVVTMHRDHQYGTFQQVQDELNSAICDLAPAGLTGKIAFLSLGADVGSRTVRVRGRSALSGEYVVEDVVVDGEHLRRLFYASSPLVIQSEAKLKLAKNKQVVDLAHLTCQHHVYMSVGAALGARESGGRGMAVVGLGGGGLCSFLHRFLPKSAVVGVDIDEEMLKVATDWFGFRQSEGLQARIEDGVAFLTKAAERGERYAAVLFDVDSKDRTIGMSCPPREFLEEGVLGAVARLVGERGCFVLNLVVRDGSLRPGIVSELKGWFSAIVGFKLEEDLNEVLICTNFGGGFDALKSGLREAATKINDFFNKNKSSRNSSSIDIDDFIKSLHFNE